MARRQFNVSVVVGLALVVVAALIAVRAPRLASMETAAHHRIVQPETPRLDNPRGRASATQGADKRAAVGGALRRARRLGRALALLT